MLAALLTWMLLGLAACGGGDSSPSGRAGGKVSSKPLRVGVSPVPHGEILQFVKDHLAAKAGLNLEIKEYSDYLLPNTDLESGDLDANYFQVPAYLKQQAKSTGIPLVSVVGVHVEPLGLYSRTVKRAGAIADGATIALPKGPVTVSRSLRLLAADGLITLRDARAATITLRDVASNPKRLRFSEVAADQTPRALDDHDLAVINGNYALEAGLRPATEALLLEKVAGNPNVNLLATVKRKARDPRILKLAELLTSPQVRKFIDERYQGAVVPAF